MVNWNDNSAAMFCFGLFDRSLFLIQNQDLQVLHICFCFVFWFSEKIRSHFNSSTFAAFVDAPHKLERDHFLYKLLPRGVFSLGFSQQNCIYLLLSQGWKLTSVPWHKLADSAMDKVCVCSRSAVLWPAIAEQPGLICQSKLNGLTS